MEKHAHTTKDAAPAWRVRVRRAVGFGVIVTVALSWSIPAAFAADPPDAPTLNAAEPDDGGAFVLFDAPENDAGSPIIDSAPNNGGRVITGYTATCISTNGGVTRSASNATSPVVVTALTNGKTYQCKVRATNVIGDSAKSSLSRLVVPRA